MLSLKNDWSSRHYSSEFKKAIIEPEKVIAPIAAPKDISIKLASFIFPAFPKLNASGFRKAEIAKYCCKTYKHEIQQPILA